jgi:hypothetical protein
LGWDFLYPQDALTKPFALLFDLLVGECVDNGESFSGWVEAAVSVLIEITIISDEIFTHD